MTQTKWMVDEIELLFVRATERRLRGRAFDALGALVVELRDRPATTVDVATAHRLFADATEATGLVVVFCPSDKYAQIVNESVFDPESSTVHLPGGVSVGFVCGGDLTPEQLAEKLRSEIEHQDRAGRRTRV